MKILISLNNSDQSQKILEFSSQIVQHAGEAPTLLFITEREVDQQDQWINRIISSAQNILGVPEITTRVKSGDIVQEITRETKQEHFDLLISGEIPSNLMERFLNVSNTLSLVERVACPVIVVKGVPRPIQKILLCDSGSGKSTVLCGFTAHLVDLLDVEEEITVLHVMSQISAGPGVKGAQLRANVEELIEEKTPEGLLLERDVQALDQPGINTIPKVRHGLVVDEILNEARKGDYDLVVIGAHQGEKWQHYLLENLAKKILLQAKRPLLVVK